MSTPLPLGTILTSPQARDAVHVAIAPITAEVDLQPGWHVGVSPDDCTKASPSYRPHVGVVDPYLKRSVRAGQQCWLFVYPQTVQGLRHDWTHPAFKDAAPAAPVSVAIVPSSTDVEVSVEWIRDWAASTGAGLHYSDAISMAKRYVEDGYQSDAYDWLDVSDTFWDHFDRATGTVTPANRRSNFTCSGGCRGC